MHQITDIQTLVPDEDLEVAHETTQSLEPEASSSWRTLIETIAHTQENPCGVQEASGAAPAHHWSTPKLRCDAMERTVEGRV